MGYDTPVVLTRFFYGDRVIDTTDGSLAEQVSEQITEMLDAREMAVLYSDTGAQDFDVRIRVSLVPRAVGEAREPCPNCKGKGGWGGGLEPLADCQECEGLGFHTWVLRDNEEVCVDCRARRPLSGAAKR